jgi:hypothetical protein
MLNVRPDQPGGKPGRSKVRAGKLDISAALDPGLRLLEYGFRPVVIYPRGFPTPKGLKTGKEPFSKDWGVKQVDSGTLTADVRYFVERGHTPGWGLCLGPGRGGGDLWLIDVECDGPEAAESLARLFGGEVVATMGWSSTRGGHYLLIVDGDRMTAILARMAGSEKKGWPGVYHLDELPGVELRIGGYHEDGTLKQLQSVCPPTPGTDGMPREWTATDVMAHAPEAFYLALEAIADEVEAKAPPVRKREAKPRKQAAAIGDKPERLTRYALAALADVAGQIAGTPEGGRHDLLRDESLNLAGLVKAEVLEEGLYRSTLQDAARDCGLPDGEASELIESALEIAKPRDLTKAQEWQPAGRQSGRDGQATATGDAHHMGNGDGRIEVEQRPRPERIPVEITTLRHEVLRETVAALSRDKGVYSLGESLVTVADETDDEIRLTRSTTLRGTAGAPTVLMLSDSNIGCILTSVADFWQWRRDKSGEPIAVSTHPPEWLIKAVASLKRWRGIRPLLGISECPFPRPDGSIVETPGYDIQTGVFYRPAITFPPVPDRPTRDDARAAWDRLKKPVAQFPFRSHDDLVVWFEGLLTAMIRPAFPDPCPGVAMVGNRAGLGKGLLADSIGSLSQGRRNVPTTAYPSDPIEAAKVGIAVALSRKNIIHFDNLEEGSTYGNSALDSALTSTTVDGRILGTSKMTGEIDLRVLFIISGNNISPGKDAHRRWLPCNLVTNLERPEERDDLQIEDLRSYLLEHRGELVRDALTILRAHALEKRPKGGWAPLGSFENWDRVVRGAVWYATGRDCCATRRTAADEAPARLAKIALLEGWLELPGGKATATKAIEEVTSKPGSFQILRNALMHYGKDGKLPTARSLGNIIRGMKGSLVEKMKFVEAGTEHRVILWQVEKVCPSIPDSHKERETTGDRGESGESSESDSHSPRASFDHDNYAIMCDGIRDASRNESERDSLDSPDSPPTGADRERGEL